MNLLYYPGCTLRSAALPFDRSAKEVAIALGVELVELQDITCCGGLFPQTSENLMALLAPARVLVQAQRAHTSAQMNGQPPRLMTLCTFCYNTLKRTHHTLKTDVPKRAIISEYLEEAYRAEVQVVHLLEVLRDDIGYEAISKKIVNPPIEGLRVAPYYGCLLLRPSAEIGLDDPEQPTILEDLLQAIGCEVVDFPWKTECCGSFLVVNKPDLARTCSQTIIQRAEQAGAEILATTCPLCHYNLTRRSMNHSSVAVVYFTQLLGLALGIEEEQLGLHAGVVRKGMTVS